MQGYIFVCTVRAPTPIPLPQLASQKPLIVPDNLPVTGKAEDNRSQLTNHPQMLLLIHFCTTITKTFPEMKCAVDRRLVVLPSPTRLSPQILRGVKITSALGNFRVIRQGDRNAALTQSDTIVSLLSAPQLNDTVNPCKSASPAGLITVWHTNQKSAQTSSYRKLPIQGLAVTIKVWSY